MQRRLPVRAPSELVHLLSVYPGEPRLPGFPWMAYEHYRDRNHLFRNRRGDPAHSLRRGRALRIAARAAKKYRNALRELAK